jgi:hypothetical protein
MFNAYTSMPIIKPCDCEGDCENCKCKETEKHKWPEKPQNEEQPRKLRQMPFIPLD